MAKIESYATQRNPLPGIIKWVIIVALLLMILAGVAVLSKSVQKGENYISLDAKAEAQSSGKDPCDILLEWLAEAKQIGNRQRVRDIQKAQKFLGCRNIKKRTERKLMSWYAAHTVMFVKYKDGVQNSYPFWENIVLVEAKSDDEALAKATNRAREEEGDSNGTFTWSGRPAEWCFGGIRKLVTCEDPESKPGDGTEITYLEMEVDDEDTFSKLIAGEPVQVKYSS